jgi:hypothetical protein
MSVDGFAVSDISDALSRPLPSEERPGVIKRIIIDTVTIDLNTSIFFLDVIFTFAASLPAMI